MKVKRHAILEAVAGLRSEALGKERLSRELAFRLALLRYHLQGIADAITEALQPSAQAREFEGKRQDAARRHAVKDKAGCPVVEGNQVRVADPNAFNAEVEALRLTYAEALEAERERQAGVNTFLSGDVDVDVAPFKVTDFPETVPFGLLTALAPFLV